MCPSPPAGAARRRTRRPPCAGQSAEGPQQAGRQGKAQQPGAGLCPIPGARARTVCAPAAEQQPHHLQCVLSWSCRTVCCAAHGLGCACCQHTATLSSQMLSADVKQLRSPADLLGAAPCSVAAQAASVRAGSERRPIVEFAIENAQILRKRAVKQSRAGVPALPGSCFCVYGAPARPACPLCEHLWRLCSNPKRCAGKAAAPAAPSAAVPSAGAPATADASGKGRAARGRAAAGQLGSTPPAAGPGRKPAAAGGKPEAKAGSTAAEPGHEHRAKRQRLQQERPQAAQPGISARAHHSSRPQAAKQAAVPGQAGQVRPLRGQQTAQNRGSVKQGRPQPARSVHEPGRKGEQLQASPKPQQQQQQQQPAAAAAGPQDAGHRCEACMCRRLNWQLLP